MKRRAAAHVRSGRRRTERTVSSADATCARRRRPHQGCGPRSAGEADRRSSTPGRSTVRTSASSARGRGRGRREHLDGDVRRRARHGVRLHQMAPFGPEVDDVRLHHVVLVEPDVERRDERHPSRPAPVVVQQREGLPGHYSGDTATATEPRRVPRRGSRTGARPPAWSGGR